MALKVNLVTAQRSGAETCVEYYIGEGLAQTGGAMKLILLMVVAGLVLTATPALAAPQWVEDACWRYASRVTPYLSWREREAYIANCKADWTAGTQPPQGRRSYYRNRYGIPSTQHPGY